MDGLGLYVREVTPRIVAGLPDVAVRLLVHPAMSDYWRARIQSATIEPVSSKPFWPAQQWEIPLYLHGSRVDVYFYPAYDPPILAPGRLVFSVMDLTQLEFRGYHERFDLLKALYVRVAIYLAARRAAHVFTISQATQASIGRIFGPGALAKVSVTRLAARGPVRQRDAGSRNYLLYVGTDRPHKNLLRLVEAYARALEVEPRVPPLRVVGALRNPRLVAAQVRRLGLSDRVTLLGHASDEQIEECYRGALAFLYPSLREGFGIPILEAMSSGVPVVTSDVSAMAETAGGAALLVDPTDTSAIAQAILRIVRDSDLRVTLERLALKRAAEFSWDTCADEALRVLRPLVRG